ncbi:MAG: hypothetical protein ACK5WQ_02825 [Alphaproteobacteria bacterium]
MEKNSPEQLQQKLARVMQEDPLEPRVARAMANELVKISIKKNGILDPMALQLFIGFMAANRSADVCHDNHNKRRDCFHALQNSYHAALDRGAREMLGVIPRFFWKEHAATEKEPDHGLVCNISLWPISQKLPHCELKQQDDAPKRGR